MATKPKGQKTAAPKFGTPEWRKLHPRKTAGAKPEPKEKYVTTERFEALEGGVSRILDMLEKGAGAAPAADPAAPVSPATATAQPNETPIDKQVRKAGANEIPMNPEWEEMAHEIIGEPLDHCEIAYVKNGGVLFTIVIKEEFSNAGKDYLERYKQDRRTKEVGSEGIEGVENWCKLVKSNLSKGAPIARR